VSDLRNNLKRAFEDPEYRYAYAESFLNTKLAAQIKILREERKKTQKDMALLVGTKQSGFSRFEDVNHSSWNTATLWKIARALGVRLAISFETFGSLIEEKERFSRRSLERPDFANDPVFSPTGPRHASKTDEAPQGVRSVFRSGVVANVLPAKQSGIPIPLASVNDLVSRGSLALGSAVAAIPFMQVYWQPGSKNAFERLPGNVVPMESAEDFQGLGSVLKAGVR
jgi:transcriptional regulator with XRE-family HTH domain